MLINKTKYGIAVLACLSVLLLTSCFEILQLEQPAKAKPGEKIQVQMELRTDGPDENPHHGIVAMKIPSDWVVEKVSMRGDYGRATFEYLPPGTADGDPGNKLDYWTRALERIWEPENGMKWVVYQTKRAYKAPEIAFVDIYFDFITGGEGTFELDYLISNGALDFSDPELYAITQGHPITISP